MKNVIYKKHGSVLERSLHLTRLIYQTFLHTLIHAGKFIGPQKLETETTFN